MTNQELSVVSNDAVDNDVVINIEDIMRQIRSQILMEKMAGLSLGFMAESADDIQISVELYDIFYQAMLVNEEMSLQVQVVPVKAFLIGPLLTWLKQKLHQFIVYYLNQMASRQIEANGRLLHTIALLSQQTAQQEQQEQNV